MIGISKAASVVLPIICFLLSFGGLYVYLAMVGFRLPAYMGQYVGLSLHIFGLCPLLLRIKGKSKAALRASIICIVLILPFDLFV